VALRSGWILWEFASFVLCFRWTSRGVSLYSLFPPPRPHFAGAEGGSVFGMSTPG